MDTLIAIGAHHDDVEVRCGGTLAKYVRDGWRVVYVVACTTPYYFPTDEQKKTGNYLSNCEAIDLRKREATRAALSLGIAEENIHFFDYKSLYWYEDGTHDRQYFDGVNHTSADLIHYLEEQIPGRGYMMSAHQCTQEKAFIADFIRKHDARVVLTHHPDDGHWEHYGTCRLVTGVLRNLVDSGMDVKGFSWGNGGATTLAGTYAPTHFEDITTTIDAKCEAVTSFVSQFPDHDTTPFVERARAHARVFGKLAGVEYAEAFVELNLRCKGAGFSPDPYVPHTYNPALAEGSLLA